MEELYRVGRRANPKLLHQGKQCEGCRPNPLMFPRRLNAPGMVDTLKATGQPAVLPTISLKVPYYCGSPVGVPPACGVFMEVCVCPLHFVG